MNRSDHGETSSKVLPIDRGKRRTKETIESHISSANRSVDTDLDELLSALDELSTMVKSGALDAVAADDAIKRAAVWAVRTSVLDRQARSLAVTDDLTGFFNRRGFLPCATQQLKLAHRDGQSLLLLFCDVDNLKAINDSFGHQEGDLALVRSADALEETFRDSDVMARLGGDEFAVLAWEASIPDKEAMLARLETTLRKINAEGLRYELSLSIGVARYDPQHSVSLGELMAAADKDMYRDKNRRFRTASSRHP